MTMKYKLVRCFCKECVMFGEVYTVFVQVSKQGLILFNGYLGLAGICGRGPLCPCPELGDAALASGICCLMKSLMGAAGPAGG